MDTAKTSPARKRLLKDPRLIALVLAGVAAAAGYAFMHFRPDASQSSESQQYIVQNTQVLDTVPARLVLVPRAAAIISSVSGGTIAQKVMSEGDKVKPGDIISVLSNTELERQLTEAESELAGVKADHAGTVADVQDIQLTRKSEVMRAETDLKVVLIQIEAERFMLEKGVSASIAVRKLEAEVAKAKAQVDFAKARYAQSIPAGNARINASHQKVSILQEKRDSLSKAVDALTIRAPIDGVIAKLETQIGKVITPGTQVAEVISEALDLQAEIAEQYAQKIRPGQQVITNKSSLKADITSVAPRSDNGVIRAQARIVGDQPKDLRSDMVLSGDIVIASSPAQLHIANAEAGLENTSQNATVMLQGNASNLKKVSVVFGQRVGNNVIINAGVSPGDVLIFGDLEKDSP